MTTNIIIIKRKLKVVLLITAARGLKEYNSLFLLFLTNRLIYKGFEDKYKDFTYISFLLLIITFFSTKIFE